MSTVAASRSPPHPLGPRRQPGASAMPAAQPPFPIYVLSDVVDMADLIGKPDPGQGWWEIPCASRKAYGCGKSIQKALEGLVLYARLGDGPHLNSSLAIRMTEDARRRFEMELDADYYLCRAAELPSDLIAGAGVEMAEEHGVTAVRLSFTHPVGFVHNEPELCYYLVYDSIARSLSMFQIRPDPCQGIYEGVCTWKPVVPKRTDASDYKLLLLGRDYEDDDEDEDEDEHDDEDRSSSSDYRVVLWVVSLSPFDGVPSKLMSMEFPQGLTPEPFKVDVAFSCQGKAFWCDLLQGLLYYDLHNSDDFGFVKLPREYEDNGRSWDQPPLPVRNTRTMGCVGDSVWFVCADLPSHYTNSVVRIWELVLPEEQEKVMGKGAEWKDVVEEVPSKVLRELSSFKKAGLPVAPFRYPILTPDGDLCFVLVDQSFFPERRPLVDHFCIFDMRYKRLLWHGLVSDYPTTDSLIMYPSSSFLDVMQCPLQRSSAEECRATGLGAVTWSQILQLPAWGNWRSKLFPS